MRAVVARPGRNAARQAKKLKEIRQVENAIKWHAKERKKRQTLRQQQWESKQAVIQRIKWENKNVHEVRKKALAEVKEDWKLGPLRPSRAFGEDKAKYGALTGEQVQKPVIPLASVKNRNEWRERQGLAPEYPLVVDDKKYFPIVKDDRVAIMKGKDKGKIGIVVDVVDRSHGIIVKGLNMQYFDSDLFNGNERGLGPRHEAEMPLDFKDVRLVVPYEVNRNGVRKYTDAIVEDVRMERHTTGIDPFTGTDYGTGEIPKDHQYDPRTGLPIFHRYIAGTQQRIEWPWEKPVEVKVDEFSGILKRSKAMKKDKSEESMVQKVLTTIRHPITSIKSLTAPKPTSEATEPVVAKPPAAVQVPGEPFSKAKFRAELKQKLFEARERERQKPVLKSPKVERKEGYDGVDSGRNIVEGGSSSWHTLVAPPFPDELTSELRDDVHDRNIEVRKSDDAPPKIAARRENRYAESTLRAAQRGAQSMKTPMQLRWEREQVRKSEDKKKNPLVSTDALLVALGKHMVRNGVKVPKKTRKVAEEVD
ncbi:hypothetical protein NX059_008994 [Plenodomus lindquistii]|nr:hypothetical protein NX059_008994 [Plenodomus lindquistii]